MNVLERFHIPHQLLFYDFTVGAIVSVCFEMDMDCFRPVTASLVRVRFWLIVDSFRQWWMISSDCK